MSQANQTSTELTVYVLNGLHAGYIHRREKRHGERYVPARIVIDGTAYLVYALNLDLYNNQEKALLYAVSLYECSRTDQIEAFKNLLEGRLHGAAFPPITKVEF